MKNSQNDNLETAPMFNAHNKKGVPTRAHCRDKLTRKTEFGASHICFIHLFTFL